MALPFPFDGVEERSLSWIADYSNGQTIPPIERGLRPDCCDLLRRALLRRGGATDRKTQQTTVFKKSRA